MLLAGGAAALLVTSGLAVRWWNEVRLPDAAVNSSESADFPDDTYNPPIRVNLTPGTAQSLELGCDGQAEIRLVGSSEVIWQGQRIPTATVPGTVDGLQIGTLTLKGTRVELVPQTDSGIRVDGHEYRGTVQLFPMRNGRVLAVNVLPLEEYLFSVIDSEMPIEFGIEARKAQCVASRTYALYQMQEHRNHPHFDVYATTRSQKYLGKEYPGPKGVRWAGESANSRQVVRDTRGIVCTSHGSLFCTYFTSVCGGSTSAGSDLFSDADRVLQRVSCPWCRDAKLCRWTREIPLKDLLQVVNRHASTKFGDSVSIADHSSSREASRPNDTIDFRDGEESVSLTHGKLRQELLGARLPSPLFKAEQRKDRVIFHGRGHGHGAGFCQWGARGQGQARRSYRQILEHYYPGCELVRFADIPLDQ